MSYDSPRMEAAMQALREDLDHPFHSAPRRAATLALKVADAPVLALIEEAERRRGSMYCKVTTYELRQALGLDTTNWPNR